MSAREIRVSPRMVRAKFMYEDGYNAAEVAKALKCTRQYILWSLRVQKVTVDELQLSPNGHAGKRFKKEWNETVNKYFKKG